MPFYFLMGLHQFRKVGNFKVPLRGYQLEIRNDSKKPHREPLGKQACQILLQSEHFKVLKNRGNRWRAIFLWVSINFEKWEISKCHCGVTSQKFESIQKSPIRNHQVNTHAKFYCNRSTVKYFKIGGTDVVLFSYGFPLISKSRKIQSAIAGSPVGNSKRFKKAPQGATG